MLTGKPALRRYSTYFLLSFSADSLSKLGFTVFDLFGLVGKCLKTLVGLSGVFDC